MLSPRPRTAYGHRWITYVGDDVGALAVDARNARIARLHVDLGGHALRMCLPIELCSPSLSGAVERFEATGEAPRDLRLEPSTSRRASDTPLQLPDLGILNRARSLFVGNKPLNQSVSMSVLAQFGELEELSLYGTIGDLSSIARLSSLTGLALRFMPFLDGLPALSEWPLLDSFIAYNVGESAGKALRHQIKARAKVRPWSKHVSVSQLRAPGWFAGQYGRPFWAWPSRQAKIANAAFDEAQDALSKARSVKAAQAAIVQFTSPFNTLKGIETTERESLGEAVAQLIDEAKRVRALGVTPEMVAEWFDSVRDY